MRLKKNAYAVHRWLGLVVSVQLLAWSTGGFVFSVLDIENVRGNRDRASMLVPSLKTEQIRLTPQEAVAATQAAGLTKSGIAEISLRDRRGQPMYELLDGDGLPLAAVNAWTGEVVTDIGGEAAKRAALHDFSEDASVTSVELLRGEAPSEYRGGPMPVYRVILDHPKAPHLYISPVTGEVLKRRNKLWRIFDFFWMLHIMDYREREDFNHWLLTGMSTLAIVTSASGLVLWWWRLPTRRRSAIRRARTPKP